MDRFDRCEDAGLLLYGSRVDTARTCDWMLTRSQTKLMKCVLYCSSGIGPLNSLYSGGEGLRNCLCWHVRDEHAREILLKVYASKEKESVGDLGDGVGETGSRALLGLLRKGCK